MEPYGIDLDFNGTVSVDVLDELLTAVLTAWPEGHFEVWDRDMPLREATATPWGAHLPLDFFVYKDRAAFASWTAAGWTPENATSMVFISASPENLHFVLDPESEKFVQGLIDIITQPTTRVATSR